MNTQNASPSPELEALLESSRPIQDLNSEALAKSIRDLESSPVHVAETRKAAFIEDVLRALEADAVTKSELARRLGKSRQQLNILLDENKRNNFTIETMAKLSTALGRKLIVRMLASETEVQLNRNIVVQRPRSTAALINRKLSASKCSISSRALKQAKKSAEQSYLMKLAA